jgi:hypothetical protein
LEFFIYAIDIETAPPLILNIMDRDDSSFDKDDFIGRAIIFPKNIGFSYDDKVPKPDWYSVGMGFGGEPSMQMGEILCSFSIVGPEYTYLQSCDQVNLRPESDDFNIEINVLGLRDLESPGLLPVKKAFIKFNLKSLLPPALGGTVQNIKTSPSDSGQNPNINTTIKFQLQLPTDPLFCPTLTCEVFDYVFRGKCQPLLGTFTIPIGDLLINRELEIERDLNDMSDIVRKLQDFMVEKGMQADYVVEERKENIEYAINTA